MSFINEFMHFVICIDIEVGYISVSTAFQFYSNIWKSFEFIENFERAY